MWSVFHSGVAHDRLTSSLAAPDKQPLVLFRANLELRFAWIPLSEVPKISMAADSAST